MANFPNRVGGYFINSDDFMAFKGDTAQFQTFLDACAALAEVGSKALHIHSGKGLFQGLNKEKPAVPCDWQLTTINQYWHTAANPNPQGLEYTLDVQVWLDGAVDFTRIKVPEVFKVEKD